MSDVAIRVENLGKLYRLGQTEHYKKTLRESLVGVGRRMLRRPTQAAAAKGSPKEFWALKDVSFEVKRGEVVGIIGRNGAGKSTLLKILSRITEPSIGRAELHGRVGSLLEVGTGFHPELTGRENIFLNGAILGMTRGEIKSRFDEIVAFSGVEEFVDTPVKRYSSGMYVRLAFAVAAHLEPEILIVDEVLAVGDADFQKKCLGKMGDVARSGRTVLFVSHNMAAVESLCNSAVRLEKGRVVDVGEVDRVLANYAGTLEQGSADVDLTAHTGRTASSTPLLRRLRMLDERGRPAQSLTTGDDVRFEITIAPCEQVRDASVIAYLVGPHRDRVVGLFSKYQYPGQIDVSNGAVVACTLKNLRLMPGRYGIELLLRHGRHTLDEVTDLTLDVLESDVYGTGSLPPLRRSGCFAPEVEWYPPTELPAEPFPAAPARQQSDTVTPV